MTPEELERALRESLAQRAALPPAAAVDRAGGVIRRARRRQRRRTLAGVGLAAVATVLVSAGAAQISPPTGPSGLLIGGDLPEAPWADPAPTRSAADQGRQGWPTRDGDPPVEVVVGSRLISKAGARDGLAQVGTVVQVQRVPDGWAVVGRQKDGAFGLWFLPSSGPPRSVLVNLGAAVVSPDGERTAWRYGERLYSAVLDGDEVHDVVSHATPATAVPVGFLGEAVLLRRQAGDSGEHDLWWPGTDSYRSVAPDRVTAIYGLLADGRTAVGRVPASTRGTSCLALLDVGRGLAPEKTRCLTDLRPGDAGSVSPDGHWLLVNAATGKAGTGAEVATVVDLATAFGGSASGPVTVGPAMTGAVDWLTAGAAAYLDGSRAVVRLDVARSGRTGGGSDVLPVGEQGTGTPPVLATGPRF